MRKQAVSLCSLALLAFAPQLFAGKPGRSGAGQQKVEKLHPKYLCTPADKNGEGMWNETDHLALYGFENGHEFSPPKTVYAKDQFGNHQLRVMRSMLLGVPSKKTLPVK